MTRLRIYGLAAAIWRSQTCIAAENLIAIDAGHSLQSPGATSATGKPEFAFNKVLATTVSDLLVAHGTQVVRINHDGQIADLTERTANARAAGATFFLSIHHDSVQPQYLKPWQWQGETRQYSDYAAGFSLFVSRKNPQLTTSLNCASAIGAALKLHGFHPSPHHHETIKGENRAWAIAENGVYYYDDLIVLKTAASPAVLLEAGVIVNRDEELRLEKPDVREAIAGAVESGLRVCGAMSASP
jgi:N-acetylmuramoyl-L-alanine amidase